MTASSDPLAKLSDLPNADGSATFSYCGYAVTAAVNGPIEAPRRDENPFEALIDVVVRPAAGVGGTAERQVESILQAALRQLIPVRNFPRCMIQITLQVMETPENAYQNTKLLPAQLNLAVIPALFHAAILGLLIAAVPLKTIATATTLAIPADSGGLIVDPSTEQSATAKSLHALAFTSHDELLLVESSGSFSFEDWDRVLETGQRICCHNQASDLDAAMSGDGPESQSIKAFIRSVLETKAAADLHWK
ncbi:Ribosomal protein S5 domain 2-type fold protein [Metarhizium album ARSEF 1941]|uniref:Ribosomal protein S5 domain 2-type fold protein n=1 Tax=Metarhizium album (strain ARSEF 1941) TaxID=1081103 RepID=A0A0B2WN28_METAS|nr:Ribosomal protein S5 domain 2-type fold protein [Metarhizium album ARSEF 1941]KHN95323.1 Ribosomal protein S5 domain 2-type fold protein [Metarhizium album ARSEF 1941]